MKRSTLVRTRLPDGPAATLLARRLPTFERLTGLHVQLMEDGLSDLDLVALDPRVRHMDSYAPLDGLVPPLDLSACTPDQLRRCRIDGDLVMIPCSDSLAFAISKNAPNPEGAALLLRCFCAPSSRTPPPDTLVAHEEH